MGFWTATIWHYVFSGFNENVSIFKNPFLAKSRARHQKAQKWGGGAPTQIYFAIFPGPWFWAFPSKFSNRQPQKHILPAVLGMSALDGGLRPWYRPERKLRVHRSESETALPRSLICSMSLQDGRCVFLGPLAVTAARRLPTKHCKNRDFLPADAAHPIFRTHTGSILERIGPKKHPIIEHNSIYIYIHIYKKKGKKETEEGQEEKMKYWKGRKEIMRRRN